MVDQNTVVDPPVVSPPMEDVAPVSEAPAPAPEAPVDAHVPPAVEDPPVNEAPPPPPSFGKSFTDFATAITGSAESLALAESNQYNADTAYDNAMDAVRAAEGKRDTARDTISDAKVNFSRNIDLGVEMLREFQRTRLA